MSADGLDDVSISMILSGAHTIAVVGASAKEGRPSHNVMAALIKHGFEVHPINPGLAGQTLLGRRVYGTLADVPGPISLVNCFRAPDAMPHVASEVIDQMQRLSITCLWMQLGVINFAAAKAAAEAGLVVVMDRCIKVELARLAIEPVTGSG